MTKQTKINALSETMRAITKLLSTVKVRSKKDKETIDFIYDLIYNAQDRFVKPK